MDKVVSKNGVFVRLTRERWKHIVLIHPSLSDKEDQVLNTIQNPDHILR